MKFLVSVVALCLVVSVPMLSHGQDKKAIRASKAGCGTGRNHIKTVVSMSPEQTPRVMPGDALVYFVNPASGGIWIGKITAAVGADGHWITEVGGRSHVAYVMAAGEHHLCGHIEQWQGGLPYTTTLLGVHLKSGHTYYIRVWATIEPPDGGGQGVPMIQMTEINPDEGRFLVAATRVRVPASAQPQGGRH